MQQHSLLRLSENRFALITVFGRQRSQQQRGGEASKRSEAADTDVGLQRRRLAASLGGRAWNRPPSQGSVVQKPVQQVQDQCVTSPGLSAGSPGDLDGAEDNAVDSLSLSGEDAGVSDPEDSADGDASSRPSSTPLYEGESWVWPRWGGADVRVRTSRRSRTLRGFQTCPVSSGRGDSPSSPAPSCRSYPQPPLPPLIAAPSGILQTYSRFQQLCVWFLYLWKFLLL